MMTPKERAVMQQALDALEELFYSNSTKVAVEKYDTAHNALLEALEQPNEIDWIETNKALAKEIIELKKQADISALPIIIEAAVKEAVLAEREKQAEQSQLADASLEPVGYFAYDEEHDIWEELTGPNATGATKLYTAPVRTKDLTDDEMEELCRKYARFELIREAIAADRSKNGII